MTHLFCKLKDTTLRRVALEETEKIGPCSGWSRLEDVRQESKEKAPRYRLEVSFRAVDTALIVGKITLIIYALGRVERMYPDASHHSYIVDVEPELDW